METWRVGSFIILNVTSWFIFSENIKSLFVRQIRGSKKWKSRDSCWLRQESGLLVVCTVCVFTCGWVLMREKFGEIEPLTMCETCWLMCYTHICLVHSHHNRPSKTNLKNWLSGCWSQLYCMQILYLLSFVDDRQRGHITVLVSPEHLAHGACRCLTGEAVDVDLLLLMLVTHQLLLLCFG